MKKLLLSLLAIGSFQWANAADTEISTKDQERALIKSMVGTYKVTFEFGETFAPDREYKYHDRKFDWGIEHVFVVEETEDKIALQHLLIVSDSMIIKHWRQDWIYENQELLAYQGDNQWKKVTIPEEKAKGTWTQKVFQVDDGPRYEGYGTWVHVDGRHFWESTADAPLPRREITKRQDYNVLTRHSHIELFDDGTWVLEQDNEKIIRKDGKDQLLCWEKGMESFTKNSYNPVAATTWWTNNASFWNDVRKCWDVVLAPYSSITMKSKVNDERLYEALFALGDTYALPKKYNSKKATTEIMKVLNDFIVGEK